MAASEKDRETAMGWVLLAIGVAAVAGVVAVLRRAERIPRHSGMATSRQRPHTERVERPHRRVAHYHASGALPRWDP
jgi:hypothetical protein